MPDSNVNPEYLLPTREMPQPGEGVLHAYRKHRIHKAANRVIRAVSEHHPYILDQPDMRFDFTEGMPFKTEQIRISSLGWGLKVSTIIKRTLAAPQETSGTDVVIDWSVHSVNARTTDYRSIPREDTPASRLRGINLETLVYDPYSPSAADATLGTLGRAARYLARDIEPVAQVPLRDIQETA